MGVNQERTEVIILKVLELSLQNPLHPFSRRKLESDAEDRCRYGRCRRTIFLCSDETLQRLRNLMPKSRITVAPGPIHGKSLQ